jgi:hypothetical protein
VLLLGGLSFVLVLEDALFVSCKTLPLALAQEGLISAWVCSGLLRRG